MKGLINFPKVTKLTSRKKGLSAYFVRLLSSVLLLISALGLSCPNNLSPDYYPS